MKSKNEIWKDIPNYEGLYQISNLGNIKTIKKGNKLLKPWFSKTDGYYHIRLWKSGHKKDFTIQRLMALTYLNWKNYKFTENDFGLTFTVDNLCVNHKDENKLNNNR